MITEKKWGKNIIDMLMKDEMPTTFSREKKTSLHCCSLGKQRETYTIS
jgi:hypothetical protein